MRIAVVSDTHGALPPGIADALGGVDRILHAGDIGGQHIIDELELIAPVTAVRGNMDTGELEWRLQDVAVMRLEDMRIVLGHKATDLLARGLPEGTAVVVSGHTHRPKIQRIGEVLFVDPGSAGGHNRDGSGPTAAIIELEGGRAEARIVELP